MNATQKNLASFKSVIDEDGEVPDLTVLSREDFKPFSQLPQKLQALLKSISSGKKRRASR